MAERDIANPEQTELDGNFIAPVEEEQRMAEFAPENEQDDKADEMAPFMPQQTQNAAANNGPDDNVAQSQPSVITPAATPDYTPAPAPNVDEMRKLYADIAKDSPDLFEKIEDGKDAQGEYVETTIKLSGNKIRDYGHHISAPEKPEPSDVDMLMAAAEKHGWKAIKAGGTDEFKSQVWRKCTEKGIALQGYQPTEADKAFAKELKEAKANNGGDKNHNGKAVADFVNKMDNSGDDKQALEKPIEGGTRMPTDKPRPAERFMDRVKNLADKPAGRLGIFAGVAVVSGAATAATGAAIAGTAVMVGYGAINTIRDFRRELKANKEKEKARAAEVAKFMAKGFDKKDLPKHLRKADRWGQAKPWVKLAARTSMYAAAFAGGAVGGVPLGMAIAAGYGTATLLEKTGAFRWIKEKLTGKKSEKPKQDKQSKQERRKAMINTAVQATAMIGMSFLGKEVGEEVGEHLSGAVHDAGASVSGFLDRIGMSGLSDKLDSFMGNGAEAGVGEATAGAENQTEGGDKSNTGDNTAGTVNTVIADPDVTNPMSVEMSVDVDGNSTTVDYGPTKIQIVEQDGIQRINFEGNISQIGPNASASGDALAMYKELDPEGYERTFVRPEYRGGPVVDPLDRIASGEASSIVNDYMEQNPDTDIPREQLLEKAKEIANNQRAERVGHDAYRVNNAMDSGQDIVGGKFDPQAITNESATVEQPTNDGVENDTSAPEKQVENHKETETTRETTERVEQPVVADNTANIENPMSRNLAVDVDGNSTTVEYGSSKLQLTEQDGVSRVAFQGNVSQFGPQASSSGDALAMYKSLDPEGYERTFLQPNAQGVVADPLDRIAQYEAQGVVKQYMEANPDTDIPKDKLFERATEIVKDQRTERVGVDVDRVQGAMETGSDIQPMTEEQVATATQQATDTNTTDSADKTNVGDAVRKTTDKAGQVLTEAERMNTGARILTGQDEASYEAQEVINRGKGVVSGTQAAHRSIDNAVDGAGDVKDGVSDMRENGVNRENTNRTMKGVRETAAGVRGTVAGAERVLDKVTGEDGSLGDLNKTVGEIEKRAAGGQTIVRSISRIFGNKGR